MQQSRARITCKHSFPARGRQRCLVFFFFPWMQYMSYLASFVMTMILKISVAHHVDDVKLARARAPADTSLCVMVVGS